MSMLAQLSHNSVLYAARHFQILQSFITWRPEITRQLQFYDDLIFKDKEPELYCQKRHRLVKCLGQDTCPYSEGAECDLCKRYINLHTVDQRLGFFRCPECQYDLCTQCSYNDFGVLEPYDTKFPSKTQLLNPKNGKNKLVAMHLAYHQDFECLYSIQIEFNNGSLSPVIQTRDSIDKVSKVELRIFVDNNRRIGKVSVKVRRNYITGIRIQDSEDEILSEHVWGS